MGERRLQDPETAVLPIMVPCRHCWHRQALERDRIEITEGRVWHRCRACEDWYLVRWEDAVGLGLAPPVADVHSDL